MVYYEIPLTPNAQRFYVTLASVQYLVLLVWRGVWILDISTSAGVPIIQGIPLVTGVDLLEAYPDANIGGSLYVTTDGDPDAPPTYLNLGVAGRLYFGVPA